MTERIAKTILAKLYRRGYIGRRHTSIDNLPKGFPKHLRGDVTKVAKKLNKRGLVLFKPTSYGIQVSLNPRRMAEIEEIIRD